ncbi:MAG: S46 family peptidase [Bacteroidia bacterium]
MKNIICHLRFRAVALILGLGLFQQPARADEGMWLPIQLSKIESRMKEAGFRLSATDLYQINQAAVKDAIVRLGGGFCTAEIVSDQGLVLTNHHCAYDLIQNHSTVEKDYLTNGFWAMSRAEELPNPGLTASTLVRMEDVTNRVNDSLRNVPEAQRAAIIAKVSKIIADEASAEKKGYQGDVRPIFYGNQFILSVYMVYKDVRLVGAPPSSIGKFGGDTDNWMWPRHTGDFSVLRIYTGPNGESADYDSLRNIPLKPNRYLAVCTSGVQKGDYTMVMGYPGTTNRYLSSDNLDFNLATVNAMVEDMIGARMQAYKEDMDKDDKIRIALASTYASGMNTYKYYQGQSLGLRKDGLGEKKRAYENGLRQWIGSDPARVALYGSPLETLSGLLNQYRNDYRKMIYFRQALGGQAFVRHYRIMGNLQKALEAKKPEEAKIMAAAKAAQATLKENMAEYFPGTEQKAFARMLRVYLERISPADRPPFLSEMLKKAEGENDKEKAKNLAKTVFKTSFLADPELMEAFLSKPNAKKWKKDPGVQLALAISDYTNQVLMPADRKAQADQAPVRRQLMAANMAYQSQRIFAPDANSTLRLTYGNVKPYVPRDGVDYLWFTTHRGILQKEDPNNEEFIVPNKLKEDLSKGDFVPYGRDGELVTCFISNNDITGGNSGSPVMNANAELVGIAFDGNWESMTGDLMFNDQVQRTISVDIRYVLYVIDRFAGAGHLVREMKLVP